MNPIAALKFFAVKLRVMAVPEGARPELGAPVHPPDDLPRAERPHGAVEDRAFARLERGEPRR